MASVLDDKLVVVDRGTVVRWLSSNVTLVSIVLITQ